MNRKMLTQHKSYKEEMCYEFVLDFLLRAE
jgi:hypothetical protein